MKLIYAEPFQTFQSLMHAEPLLENAAAEWPPRGTTESFFLFFVFLSDVPCRSLDSVKATDDMITLNWESLENRKSKYMDTGNMSSSLFSVIKMHFPLKLIS